MRHDFFRTNDLSWLLDSALPFWREIGMDNNFSFVDRVSLNAQPLLNHPRRCITQARQIYVFARAALNGWIDDAERTADRAFTRFVQTMFEADGIGGWAFSCDARGGVVDPRRDFYSQAFALLACAQHAILTGNAKALDIADRTLQFLDAFMASPQGGYAECYPHTSSPRRQNPHMHLFEALLALHVADPSRGYLARASKIKALFDEKFLAEKGRRLVEFMDDSWSPLNSQPTFEPGHHFEWVWLLHLYENLSDIDTSQHRTSLFQSGCQGFRSDGILFDEVSLDTGPVIRSTRLWPLTEAIKAVLISPTMESGLPTANSCWTSTQNLFIAPAPVGCWHDHFNENGSLLVDFVPASTLYHIVCAVDFWFNFE
jgi:mannose/cellobiose epimerase-like protein (N-acyl-D-glucosamine 2-epimerase family)